MTDSVSDIRKAKEGSYFDKKNKEALARLKEKMEADKPRLSPVTGEAMEQEVIGGVVVDRCKSSGGVWLDAGELEEIVEQLGKAAKEEPGFFKSFMGGLSGKS